VLRSQLNAEFDGFLESYIINRSDSFVVRTKVSISSLDYSVDFR
jgi:hypothetical protein